MEPLADRIIEASGRVGTAYHRLVLVVGPAGAGKTAAMRAVAERTSAKLINVSLELARQLIDMPKRQRQLGLFHVLMQLLRQCSGEMTLFDNTEILFDPVLRKDPLRLLQALSRNTTVVASWNGRVESGNLVYAEPGHPEYKYYPTHDLMIVAAEESRC